MHILSEVRLLSLASLTVACSATFAAGSEEDWPQWRGPNADGRAEAVDPPITWSESSNVVWTAETPGVGHSSPIVVGDAVFLTAADIDSGERLLICYDRASGDERWRRVIVSAEIETMHAKNTPASSTPAAADGLVITNFAADGEYLVSATRFDGSPVWSRRLASFVSRHGFHSPPILEGESVLLSGLQDSGESFVARLNAADGETLWQSPTGSTIRSFSPPHVTSVGQRRLVVVSGANRVVAFDYETGKLAWDLPGPAEKTVSSIVESGGLLLVAGGRDSRLLAIDPAGAGTIAWASTSGVPYVSSPVIVGEDLFMVSDRGIATRLRVSDHLVGSKRRLAGPVSASPILAAGRLYVCDETGKTFVLTLQDGGFEVLAKNSLPEPIMATPAFSGRDLFLRTTERLYCLRDNAAASRGVAAATNRDRR